MSNHMYHLVPAERWHTWPESESYLPADYADDGFVHCTSGDDLMLQVANRFYQQEPGEFLLLVIDPDQLTSPLRWEQPEDNLAPLFPHIYGPINREAIVGEKLIIRAEDGTFTSIV